MDDHMAQTPPHSAPATPRSTLGSPLTTHASRRSGVGDLAAGPRRRNSLSEVEILPWVCCMTPALCVFGLYGTLVVTSIFFETCFYVVTAGLTCICVVWVSNMAIASLVGAHKVRKATATDWHARLLQVQEVDPEGSSCLHVVILPNYRENERMLKETLDNIGNSPLAPTRIRVVLAMEAREGPAGHEKAERLIQQTSHLFADIFATYHPENLPGEVAGKSSNTQWAFREALRHLGPILLGFDLSRVLLTVGDADTLWHPQYFSALTYSALMMSQEERVWRMWQPPVLLMRNYSSVPAMTRASAAATLVFELSALTNQMLFPAFAYSAYSMTLALASHPEVDGWDVDVIAEDHHMFCKCYFAALWELAHHKKDQKLSKAAAGSQQEVAIVPQVQVEAIFLPAVAFLVESNSGYWNSLWARFEQARRHMQGVVELGYVLLQYSRLVHHTGFWQLPGKAHRCILIIAAKLHILHITTTAQCLGLVLAVLTTLIPNTFRWLAAGNLSIFLRSQIGLVAEIASSWQALDAAQQVLATSLSQISGVIVLYAVTCFIVTLDLVEGRYYAVLPQRPATRAMLPLLENEDDDRSGSESASPVQASASALPEEVQEVGNSRDPVRALFSFVEGPLTRSKRLHLLLMIFADTLFVGYPAIICFAVIPLTLAAWSLFRRGTDFEYIVAMKPE